MTKRKSTNTTQTKAPVEQPIVSDTAKSDQPDTTMRGLSEFIQPIDELPYIESGSDVEADSTSDENTSDAETTLNEPEPDLTKLHMDEDTEFTDNGVTRVDVESNDYESKYADALIKLAGPTKAPTNYEFDRFNDTLVSGFLKMLSDGDVNEIVYEFTTIMAMRKINTSLNPRYINRSDFFFTGDVAHKVKLKEVIITFIETVSTTGFKAAASEILNSEKAKLFNGTQLATLSNLV